MLPSDPRFDYATRLHQARRYAEAEQAYRFVLSHQPNHTDALLRFGTLLHETGRHEEAVDTLRRGVAVSHKPIEFRRALVAPLVALDELSLAIEQASEVARLTPVSAEPHLTLAQLHARAGDLAAAEPAARRAIELGPTSAIAWLVMARVLVRADRPGDAMAMFDRSIDLSPGFVDAHAERAYLLQSMGRLSDAVDGYAMARRAGPLDPATLNNAATCYLLLGRPADAVPLFETAVQRSPDDAGARNNLGAALKEAGRIDDALAQLDAAFRIDPDYVAPAINAGACHAAIGAHARAMAAYGAAERIDPLSDVAGSNKLASLLAMDGVEPAAVRVAHVEWARRHADPIGQSPPPIRDPDPNRRLRIGYVSPDFRENGLRHFIEPVLAKHDRSAVEIICFAIGRRRDQTTTRLAKLADAWHDLGSLDAIQTADLIRSHQIDVLVDLAGHAPDNRLLAFARRPAPVRVGWLGHAATAGAQAIQYRLTDGIADRPGNEPLYVEQLVRLPGGFCVYADDPAKPYDDALPADENGHFTFGACADFSKVTPGMLATWARIVAAVPESRMVLKGKPLANPSTKATVLAAFAGTGVTADRLDLRPWGPLGEHSSVLGSVDLLLDTYPYNGFATTCQGLWMGTPTLTRYGTEFRSRIGLSLLTQLDATEFAVSTVEAYERRAVDLATDLTTLRDLRPTWRERMAPSPLCDAPRFVRGLEAAYREMWRTAVGGQS